MNDNCKNCNINQGNKIADALKLDEATREKLNKSILDFLNNADATKSNPEILCEMWRIIADTIGDDAR
jgi:damage-control phosphatase, subfamily I